MITREACEGLDREDPLKDFRNQFSIPEGLIYLNGNSLGAMPKLAQGRAMDVVSKEWGEGLVRSWNTAGWFEKPRVMGSKIARLIGADENEVVVTDGTGVNLYKVLSAALASSGDRRVILMEEHDFPTNRYTAQGLIQHLSRGHQIRVVPPEAILDSIDDETAVVCLTQVNYRTGRLLDMASICERCQSAGALSVWDLSHSAGALPVELNKAGADFAVGCTYKYMSGGPGSPAFLFVAARHQERVTQPLSGWFGHAAPFDFETDYRPADDIRRMLSGTPPMLSLCVAEVGIDLLLDADVRAVRQKSLALGQLFLELLTGRAQGPGLELASPKDAELRGSQIAFTHDDGYAIIRSLQDRGIIGDYREPNIMRFGFAPLYLRFVDVYDAAIALMDLLGNEGWRGNADEARLPVT